MSDSDDPVLVAERLFREGLESLTRCVLILRGPDVPPSPGAMKTEQVLSRAVESLSSTGFRAPRKG